MMASEEDIIGRSEVEAASTGDPDGSSDVESTQATWGPEAKRRDSGSSETWESNPEAEEEISLHEVTVGKLQKEFDPFRKESKKIDDEIDQTRMAREESINGHQDGSSNVENTQATWGSDAEDDGKVFSAAREISKK